MAIQLKTGVGVQTSYLNYRIRSLTTLPLLTTVNKLKICLFVRLSVIIHVHHDHVLYVHIHIIFEILKTLALQKKNITYIGSLKHFVFVFVCVFVFVFVFVCAIDIAR